MTKPRTPAPAFTPVATRARHDGWTAARQVAFVDALAASGCVAEACAAVGLSRAGAYALRMRPDARKFRVAWDAALDLAVRRLSDECYSRALNGVAVPHFYKGEQIGEHRRYDDRLAMFLLRYRDPLRYAATLDQMVYSGHSEQAPLAFAKARNAVMDAGHDADDTPDGEPADDAAAPPGVPPFAAMPVAQARARQQQQALADSRAEAIAATARRRREEAEAVAQISAIMGGRR